jgi:hypothetical protein
MTAFLMSTEFSGANHWPGGTFPHTDPRSQRRQSATGGWLRGWGIEGGGGAVLAGVNLMLFSLLQNLCSTARHTIPRASDSLRWTAPAAGGLDGAYRVRGDLYECSSLGSAMAGWLAATWMQFVSGASVNFLLLRRVNSGAITRLTS